MKKLERFRREAPIGVLVTLYRTNGSDISGRVAEIDDACVQLQSAGSTVTVFEELLSGWKVDDGEVSTTAAETVPLTPSSRRLDDRPTPTLTPSRPESATNSEAIKQLAKIKAEFSLKVERAQLAAPEPDFQFPHAEFSAHLVEDARHEWDKARNNYKYALKINEFSRLNDIVAHILEPLHARHPGSATTEALLGQVLLKLNRQSEAIVHLSTAAILSAAPAQWLALSAAAQEDSALQCYALRHHFYLSPPVREEDPWFRYVGTAIEHHDLHNTAQIIRHWQDHSATDADIRSLLAESVIYVLIRLRADGLAMHDVGSLLRTPSALPPDWEQEFTNSASTSDKLRATERRFNHLRVQVEAAATAERTLENGNGERTGRIKSFGNQRFGFIATESGDTFYFRINDVDDEKLRDALFDKSWRTFGPVEFELIPTLGHKYDRAKQILPLQTNESLLQRAQQLLAIGSPPQAMALVRRVLTADPTDKAASRLEQKVKDRIKKGLRDGIGLPKGQGSYARAKRAQIVDLDLNKAEELLREAIGCGDRLESAVKDLAMLLHQQGRLSEAIVLLESKSIREPKGTSPYDSLLATLYQHSARYDDAIAVLNRLYQAASQPKKNSFLRRIALCHLQRSSFKEAEQTLKQVLAVTPNDRTAISLVAALEDARLAETSAEVEEILGRLGTLAEDGMEFSSLARAAIERCKYQGVDQNRLRTGVVSSSDITRVINLAKELGTRRPRDRAAYYLSAAALLNKAQDRQSNRIYSCLSSYFTSMADAYRNDNKPADVVRSYYIESLALVDDNLDEAWRTLVRYLATFSPNLREDIQEKVPRAQQRGRRVPRGRYIEALEQMLSMVKPAPASEGEWREGLVAVGSQSRFARNGIGEVYLASPTLRSMFAKLLGCSTHKAHDLRLDWERQCEEYARSHRRRLAACRALAKCPATVASMDVLSEELRTMIAKTSSRVDKQRLNTLVEIVDSARDYCRASDFEERERNYRLVHTRSVYFRSEVRDNPTQYSQEGLLPIVRHVDSLIEENFARLSLTSGPELGLRLVVKRYVLGQQGELRLQIEVSNQLGCSPASSVRLRLGPEGSEDFATEHWEREVVPTLRGGRTEHVHMMIRPKEVAMQDRAFPITVTGKFQDHLGEDKRTDEQAWTVRLYPDEEFQHLENRYAPFAEGGPVDEPEMFVGRDDLLNHLENSLLSGSGSKSIVMFGQKRAGKSSLIEHLRRRLILRDGILPVSFSLQELATELSVPTLFHRILQGVAESLEDFRLDGREVPKFSPPAIEILDVHPALRFHREISSVVRSMKMHSSALRMVLLVDEFSDVFKGIRNHKIPREFMKSWKAIIEKKYFSSVLVGQDIMPLFKREFPNEFGVTEDFRVTYLDDAAATKLVQGPIGEDRFAGLAVQRILDLTANSPYYTMMFCARLVDYINMTRSVVVTEADILAVESEMLHGERRLTRDKFDNLLTAGDGIRDSGIDPEHTYAVCVAIARANREREGWCSLESVNGDFNGRALERLLSDLETRDVVERKGATYRLRVGLFRDWLVDQG